MSAGMKLIVLTVLVTLVALVRLPAALGVSAVLTVIGYFIARPTPRAAWAQLRPIVFISTIALTLNLLFIPLWDALQISARVAVIFAAAALFTLTTPASEVLDALERPLCRLFGARRAESIGLAMSLTIRSVPVIDGIVREVLDARRARGLNRSLRAFAVPVVVRSLRSADALGEALIARGAWDQSDGPVATPPQPQ